MRNGRRSFLGFSLGGLGALAGLFWPGKASALFPRRQSCGPPVGFCPPPPCWRVLGPIILNFPYQAQPTLVYGRGAFFAWGYVDNTVADPGTPLTARLVGTSQPYKVALLDTPPMTFVNSPPPPGCATFAFRFDQVETNVDLTLIVSYKDIASMTMKDGDPAAIKCG